MRAASRPRDRAATEERIVAAVGEVLARAGFFEHFIDELRQRPLTVEVMVSELQQRNELTAILEEEREAWGDQAARVLGGPEFARQPHLHTVTVLLLAGVQYLLLRSRKTRVFGGIDLQSDAGWAKIKGALRRLSGDLLGGDGHASSTPRRKTTTQEPNR